MMTAETPWPAEVTKPTDAKTAMMYWHERAMAAERDLTAAREQIAAWQEKAAVWMASPEAAKRLAGYREMADQCCTLEAERDAARARVAELETFVRWVATYPKTRGEEINVVLIRDGARALLSPSPEPQP